jgi:hypothetical protein
MPLGLQTGGMSENTRFYAQKIDAQRSARTNVDRPLCEQLEEILEAVRDCESRWALEDRIERSL